MEKITKQLIIHINNIEILSQQKLLQVENKEITREQASTELKSHIVLLNEIRDYSLTSFKYGLIDYDELTNLTENIQKANDVTTCAMYRLPL